VADQRIVDFLAVAARSVPEDGWVFSGFNWPVLACQTARELGRRVTEIYEAGAAVASTPPLLPSSTTDYAAYHGRTRWLGSTLDVLALVRRLDVVLLDAADVDLRGRINTFGAGPVHAPTFRSAGGGGAPDVAARAKRLVLLHAGDDLARVRESVEHVTAAPAADADVTLVTRWGSARLGANPAVVDVTGHPDAPEFVRRITGADPPASGMPVRVPATADERRAATTVLHRAALRGYRAAGRAVAGPS
jgi:glutaconate CoA-transferase, subunit B